MHQAGGGRMMVWALFAACLAAAVVALLVTPLSIALSHRLRLLDQPDARKVHTTATPRLGGLGIAAGAFLAGLPAFAILYGMESSPDRHFINLHLALVAGALLVFAVGLLDDVSGVPSRYKLIALTFASLAVCGAGGALGDLRFSHATVLEFPRVVSWVLTVLWITGFAVAFNFIDGLDGLSSGLAIMACAVLTFFLVQGGELVAAVPAVVLAGALLGFLYYNRHPARTFMGDGGSLSIGFLLGSLMIINNPSVSTMRSMVMPSLALSVALVDTGLTLFRRRYQQRRSIFSAERGHIHHRLLDRGFSHTQAVHLIHAVSAAAVAVGFVAINFDGWQTLGGLSLVVPLLLIFFHLAGSMRTGDMVDALRRKREIDRNSRRFRSSFESMQLEFDEAINFSEWWRTVCVAAEELRFSQIKLPIDSATDGRQRTLSWINSDDVIAEASERIDAKIPLPALGTDRGYTSAEVQIPSADSLESAGERLALFSRLMSENGQQALRRIHRTSHPNGASSAASLGAGEFASLRVAVVHDFFYTYAGAERVVEQIVNLFPHCAVFGLFDFLPESERAFLRGKPVTTTLIQKMPFASRKHRAYLPLMPLAIEQLDVSSYDLVISSSYLVAKGVITGPDQLHLCYCHSPVRYGWDLQHQYLKEAGLGHGPRGLFARAILHYLRNWDARSSIGVDAFIANSRFVARRIEKFYRRDAEVIPPPVNTEAFLPDPPESEDPTTAFYLAASRLVSYKRIDLIVEAFSQTPERKLVVIGDGPERERLERLAGPNVELLGHQDQATLVSHMQRAKAFVFAAEEDFGIVPVEAMACGTPVIAFRKGGVTESLPEGPSGVFFDHQTIPSLCDALDRFEQSEPVDEADRVANRQRAEHYSVDRFVERLSDFVRLHVEQKWPGRCVAAEQPADTLTEPPVAPEEQADSVEEHSDRAEEQRAAESEASP